MTNEPVASLEGVTHRYGAVEALSNVSLTLFVRPGHGAAGAEWRRQDDDRAPADRAGATDGRHRRALRR